MSTDQMEVTPQQFMDDLHGVWKTHALISAIELDLFTHIAAANQTAKEVARAAEASERGIERLLNALVGMNYLTKKGDKYALTPMSDAFLDRAKQSFVGGMAYSTKLTLPGWSRLTDIVKGSRPVETVDAEAGGREFFPKLVASIFPMSFAAARAAAAGLSAKSRKSIKRILDVAAGSAAWSLPFAEAIPGARVTTVDFSEVTPITTQFTRRFGVADRYDHIEGNIREVDFGRDRYDLVLLGHIIHSEGEKWGKKLLKKSHRALKDGGLLLIAEMVPNDTRTGPAFPLLFGLNMLAHTERGDVFTMRQYRQWLKEAGFSKIKTIEAPGPSPLILATK